MNIDNLTLKELKTINALFSFEKKESNGLNEMIGKKAIIRTYSAGVWFGTVGQKSGNEVIIKNARRMWRWHTKQSISLSSCSIHGINHDKSKIAEAVKEVWLEAIEIISCTNEAIESIEGAENAAAE